MNGPAKKFHKKKFGKKDDRHPIPKKEIEPNQTQDGYKNFLDYLKQRYTIVYPTPRKYGDYPIGIRENKYGMNVEYSVDIPSDSILSNQIKKFPNHFTIPRKTHEIEDLIRKAVYYGNLHKHQITSKEDYIPSETDVSTYTLPEEIVPGKLFYDYITETIVGPKKFIIGKIILPEAIKKFYEEQLSVTLKKIEYYKSISEISENGYRDKIEKLESKIQYKQKKFGLDLIEKLKKGQKIYVPSYQFLYETKPKLHSIHRYGTILFSVEELSAIIPTTIIRVSGNQRAEYTLNPIADEYFIQKVLYYVYRSPMETFYGKYKKCFPARIPPVVKSLIENPPEIYLPYKKSSEHYSDNDDFFTELRRKYPSGEIPSDVYNQEDFQKRFIAKVDAYNCNSRSPLQPNKEELPIEISPEEEFLENFQEHRKRFKSEENMDVIKLIFQAEIKKIIEESPNLKYTGPNEIEPEQRIIELYPSYMHQKRYILLKKYNRNEEGDIISEEGREICIYSISRKGKQIYAMSPEKPYMRGFSLPSLEDREKVLESLTEKEKSVFIIPIEKEVSTASSFPPKKKNPLLNDMDNAIGYWLKDVPYVYFKTEKKREAYRLYITQNEEVSSFLDSIAKSCARLQNFVHHTSQNEDIFDFVAYNYTIDYDIRLSGEVIALPSLSFSSEKIYRFLGLGNYKTSSPRFSVEISGKQKRDISESFELFCIPPFSKIIGRVDYNLLLQYLTLENIFLEKPIIKIEEDVFSLVKDENYFMNILSPFITKLEEDILFLFRNEKRIHLITSFSEENPSIFAKIDSKVIPEVTISSGDASDVGLYPFSFMDGRGECIVVVDYSAKKYYSIGKDTNIILRKDEGEDGWERVDVINTLCPKLSLGKENIFFLFWVLHFAYLNSDIDLQNIYRLFIEYVEARNMDPRYYLLAYFLEYSKIFKE